MSHLNEHLKQLDYNQLIMQSDTEYWIYSNCFTLASKVPYHIGDTDKCNR